jgi:hypothetical protein
MMFALKQVNKSSHATTQAIIFESEILSSLIDRLIVSKKIGQIFFCKHKVVITILEN